MRNHTAMVNTDRNLSPITVHMEEMTVDEINYSISHFICEIKKLDGNDYPSDTLYSIVVSLQLYFDKCGKSYKLLMDDQFSQIRHTLDNLMKQRARDGLNSGPKQAEVITTIEEDNLWLQGVLSTDTPKKLLHICSFSTFAHDLMK